MIMATAPTYEVVISYVYEQREIADTLTREFHRLGISVFCDYFEKMQPARHIALQELLAVFERADAIVVCASKEYLARAWHQDDRKFAISAIGQTKSAPVFTLLFDDCSLPELFPTGLPCIDVDNESVKPIADRIVNKLYVKDEVEPTTGSVRPPTLTALTGEAKFLDFDRVEHFFIGRDEFGFKTQWSRCNASAVHVHRNPPSVAGVAIADGYTAIDQITDARLLDFGERSRNVKEHDVVVLRNQNGHYAALEIQEVKDTGFGDDVDELKFSYVIQPDASTDFAGTFQVESLQVRGFRSLREVHIRSLGSLVALIGPNGCGKTNIFRLFELMQSMLRSRLAVFVGEHGGGDVQLFHGSKETESIEVEVTVRVGSENLYDYRFELQYGKDDRLIFVQESYRLRDQHQRNPNWISIQKSRGQVEADLNVIAGQGSPATIQSRVAANLVHVLGNICVYQFHDTSRSSGLKKPCDIDNRYRLVSDGSNLAAVLYQLEREEPRRYALICQQIGRILPGFDRFDLQEFAGKTTLRWISHSARKSYGAHLTSDGSLRLFALITLLNLPKHMLPTIVFLDGPELGLHPAGISLIGAMISSLSVTRQVVVATQSPLLLDAFDIQDILVLEADSGGTSVRELKAADYEAWLEDGFPVSELWRRNLLGGQP